MLKFDAHTHYHFDLINSKRYYPGYCCHGNHCGILYMSPRVYVHRYNLTLQFYTCYMVVVTLLVAMITLYSYYRNHTNGVQICAK